MRTVSHTQREPTALLIKSDPATIQSRYAEQATADLEENRRQQRELAGRLEVLRQEEALLLDILNLAGRSTPQSDQVPQQADGSSAPPSQGPPGGTAAPAPADTAPTDGRTRPEAAGRTSGTAPSGRKPGRQPLLGELLLDLLKAHDEPRLAKELRDELLQTRPERNPTPQVVRNTLEALVAKGRIVRHKQQRSVLYTVAEPDDDSASEVAARAATETE
jgi:hypothetical protein